MTPMTRFKRSACALLQSLPSPPLTAPHLPSPLFTPPHPSQDCCDGSDEYDGRVGHLPQHVCPGRGGKAAAAGSTPLFPPPPLAPSHPSTDCCDGSDEYDGRITCPNTCAQAGAARRQQLAADVAKHREGVRQRQRAVEEWREKKVRLQEERRERQREKKVRLQEERGRLEEEERELQEKEKALKGMSGCVLVRMCMGVRQRQRAVEEWREKKVRLQEERGRLEEEERELQEKEKVLKGRLEEEERELQEKEKALKGMSGCVLVRMCMGVRQRQRAVEEWREKKVRLQEERGRLEEERELQEKEKVLKGGARAAGGGERATGEREDSQSLVAGDDAAAAPDAAAPADGNEKSNESGKEMDDDESDEDLSGLSKEELGRRIASRWAHGEDGPGGAEVEGGDGDGGEGGRGGPCCPFAHILEGQGKAGVIAGLLPRLLLTPPPSSFPHTPLPAFPPAPPSSRLLPAISACPAAIAVGQGKAGVDAGVRPRLHQAFSASERNRPADDPLRVQRYLDQAQQDKGRLRTVKENLEKDLVKEKFKKGLGPDGEFASFADHCFSFKLVSHLTIHHVALDPLLPFPPSSIHLLFPSLLSHTLLPFPSFPNPPPIPLLPKPPSHSPPSQTPLPFPSFPNPPPLPHMSTRYEYEVCPYRQVKQKEKHHSDTTVGRWSGFEDNYRTMMFKNGDKCWNGPNRSIKVKLECGLKTGIKSVEEPSRCEYEAVLVTTAVCNAELAQELERQLKQMEDDLAGHDEL
ncbi:unnamed protein product [Closterium sp. NIES-64]|nr:unnamed protein product [Closterium sp. NIES-64]